MVNGKFKVNFLSWLIGFRERRKVQMVEQPGQKIAVRNSQAPRASPASQGRPMSTDDIQKAKMRAQFMQSKYGKSGTSNGRTDVKFENINKPLHLVSGASSPASKISLHPKFDDQKKALVSSPKISNKVVTLFHSKVEVEFMDSLGEKCKRVQIQWRMPPGSFSLTLYTFFNIIFKFKTVVGTWSMIESVKKVGDAPC